MNKEEQGRQTTMAHATVCSSQRAPNGVELPSSCQVFFSCHVLGVSEIDVISLGAVAAAPPQLLLHCIIFHTI